MSKQNMLPARNERLSKPNFELVIRQAESSADFLLVRELFLEYAQSLGFSLCFQDFDKELETLPGKYAPPTGRLLLGEYDDQPAGCAALRPLDKKICEMKRLYVRPNFRGKHFGGKLAAELIQQARSIGYKRMRLDTVEPLMTAAVAMYREMGFQSIPPYCENPNPGTLYMELEL
jgi:putative acetyltransferase